MTGKDEKDPEVEEVETERVEESPGGHFAPLVDIYETDDGIVVEADMPGVGRSDVKVEIDKGLLTIAGRVKRKPVEGVTHLYDEFTPADYYRAFTLGEEVDESGISAVMENGVLTVTLPRAEHTRVRKIEVK